MLYVDGVPTFFAPKIPAKRSRGSRAKTAEEVKEAEVACMSGVRVGNEAFFCMRTSLLGRSSTFSQAALNDLLVLPLMLENENFLAGILGAKNVGTPLTHARLIL